jgi:GT2 family glycosyltransferase
VEGELMDHAASVSIIIVNWNRGEEVLRALRHLRELGRVRGEIVVVDNGSTDGSAERLAAIESIRLVRLAGNYGPARARNVGVMHSTGKYVLFLDSDAMISRSSLLRLVERMEGDPTIGVAGCRVLDPVTRELDQWIYQHPARTHERREFDTYSFSAAGALVRREALRDAGPFWEDLFIYNEEVDLSIRVLRVGYRVIYLPRARVYHAASDRGRQAASSYWRLQIRNRIWICYRYYTAVDCYLRILMYASFYILKGLAGGHLSACLSGIRDGLSASGIRRAFPDKLTREEKRRIAAVGRWLRPRLAEGLIARAASARPRDRGPDRGGGPNAAAGTMVGARSALPPA